MRKLFTALFLLSIFSTQSVFAEDNDILDFNKSNFVRFQAQLENNWIHFTEQVYGYLEIHPFAYDLGLPTENLFFRLEYYVPANKCSWSKEQGRLSCLDESILLLFSGAKGDIFPVKIKKIEISAGVLGHGNAAVQVIGVKIDPNDKFIENVWRFTP